MDDVNYNIRRCRHDYQVRICLLSTTTLPSAIILREG